MKDNWPAKTLLEDRITAHGYALRYVEYCEDAQTPGLLGQVRGVTDHKRKTIKIGTKANPTPALIEDILAHELRHIEEPDWKCGSPEYGTFGHRI